MRTPEEKLRVELTAAKDLADFRADQLVVAMGKYASPDGAKRLEMLEELAEALIDWRNVGHLEVLNILPHIRLSDAEDAVRRDNERVERLTKKT